MKIILVTGCSGSGKTTISEKLSEILLSISITNAIISTDDFYKGGKRDNYDVPDAIDSEKIFSVVSGLLAGSTVTYPKYDFVAENSSAEMVTVEPVDILIIEGIFSAYFPEIRKLSNYVIHIQCSYDECLTRRMLRDKETRGIPEEITTEKWNKFVKPGYEKYVLPVISEICPTRLLELDNNRKDVDLLLSAFVLANIR